MGGASFLRILHLEDDSADAELARARLAHEGLAAEIEWVTNRERFEAGLADPDLDLILSDRALPGFEGVDGFARARARRPEVPFVFFTGTMGEAAAAEVVRQGAVDYVLKDQPAKLVPAIERAIAERRERVQRLAAERALHESEATLRAFFDQVGVICGIAEEIGDSMRMVEINSSCARLWGREVDEVRGRFDHEIGVPRAIVRLWHERCREARDTGAPVHFAYERELGGETHLLEAKVSCLGSGPNNHDRFAFVIDDVTERRAAEMRLREKDELFRQLAENTEVGFWFTDADAARILYVNPAIERIWGCPVEELYRSFETWYEAIVPTDRERVRQAFDDWLAGRRPRYEEEYRLARPDGTVRTVVESAVAITGEEGRRQLVSGVTRDVTEQREAERHAARAQRLESIGTLAGGIAHDLNNTLAPILIAAELLRAESPASAAEYIEMIEFSARRGADMVRQLLTFARGAEGERTDLRPVDLVEEVAKIARSTFPKSIALRVEIAAPKLPKVVGDSTQLHQALLNLCVNARDAMASGGELTLELAEVWADPGAKSPDRAERDGGWVRFRVNDTGAGIPPELLDRVFDPFFTTKGPEQGTGLGLSTMLGIVQSHGGFVRIDSTVGRGTTVDLYLPAAGSGSFARPFAVQGQSEAVGAGATVLVIDDEPMVRHMMKALLERLGFRPLQASGGTEAILLAADHAAAIRCVVCDLQMPGLDGAELLRALAVKLPEARLVAMSGLVEPERVAELAAMGVRHVLQKPFDRATLSAALLDPGT